MKIKFIRTCFGCCELRTGAIIVAVIDLILGLYDIIDFSIRAHLDMHALKQLVIVSNMDKNSTTMLQFNVTASTTAKTVSRKDYSRGALYEDSAFAIVIVGCLDVLISSFLLYVAIRRKYDLRVGVFIAAVWGFVMSFLSSISFGISVALEEYMETSIFGIFTVVELFFSYILFSYFKFMTVVVERGLDDIQMSYFPEEAIPEFTEVQMDDAFDEQPIMDDQDDYPIHGDDLKIALT